MRLNKVYTNSAVRNCVDWNAIPDDSGWDQNPDFHIGRLHTKRGIAVLTLFNDDVAEARMIYKERLHVMTIDPSRLTRAGFVRIVKKWIKTL